MASNINNDFWIKVIDEAIIRNNNIKSNNNVLYTTGPKLISFVYSNNIDNVIVLNYKLFNPSKSSDDFNSIDVIAKHVGTCTWC